MAYLTKEDLIRKLEPFGIKTVSSINRLIREQNLPTMYITPRKPFWESSAIDIWISRRQNVNLAKANSIQAKIKREQRKKSKKTLASGIENGMNDILLAKKDSEIKLHKVKEA